MTEANLQKKKKRMSEKAEGVARATNPCLVSS